MTLDPIHLKSQIKKIISVIFLTYCLNVIVFVSVFSFIEINFFSSELQIRVINFTFIKRKLPLSRRKKK